MPRASRSDIAALLREAHAIETLATDTDVGPQLLEDYWRLSADLIVLVSDIEAYEASEPQANYDDPSVFTFKQRLRAITSRLAELQSAE